MKGLVTEGVLHLVIYRVVYMVTRTDIRMDNLSLRKRCVQILTVMYRIEHPLGCEKSLHFCYDRAVEFIFVFMWYEAFFCGK
jgi:hypothetical protein